MTDISKATQYCCGLKTDCDANCPSGPCQQRTDDGKYDCIESTTTVTTATTTTPTCGNVSPTFPYECLDTTTSTTTAAPTTTLPPCSDDDDYYSYNNDNNFWWGSDRDDCESTASQKWSRYVGYAFGGIFLIVMCGFGCVFFGIVGNRGRQNNFNRPQPYNNNANVAFNAPTSYAAQPYGGHTGVNPVTGEIRSEGGAADDDGFVISSPPGYPKSPPAYGI